MIFKNFSSKSFQQKNSSMVKKGFAQILSNNSHAFSKLDIKQFWWFHNVTKENGTMKKRKKNWVQPKRKTCFCSNWPVAFRVLSTRLQASITSSIVGLPNVSIFFSPPIFCVSKVCHLLVSYRWEKAFRFKTSTLVKKQKSQ